MCVPPLCFVKPQFQGAPWDGGLVRTSLVWEKVYDTAGFRWRQMEGCGHKEMSNHAQASWGVLNEKTFGFKEAKQFFHALGHQQKNKSQAFPSSSALSCSSCGRSWI